jgi:hypothetical protein
VREAEEVEGLRFPVATRSSVRVGEATEFDEARLVGMQCQPESREPFAQRPEEALGLLTMLEAHDKVISEPHHDDRAARVPLPPSLDPEVEDIVEIDIGQQRADAPALHRTDLTASSLAVLQHAGAQPFLDETHDASVGHTVLDEADEPVVVQRIEKATNVRVEHPVHPPRFDADRQRVQRMVRAALRPESVREAEKVLLVDGVQHLDDGALDDFVLQRGNAERPLPPVRLRDVRSPDRTRSKRAPLEAGGQVAEVDLQHLTVMLPRLAVDARRRISCQPEIGRAEPLDVIDVVQQRREPLFPVPFRCLTYPLDAIRRMTPALGPVAVTVERIPLGQPASLHCLRSRFRGLVRRLPRYYRAVRLPVFVHHRRLSMDFPMRPATLLSAGDHGRSRFPGVMLPTVHGVSDRAGSRRASRWRRAGCSLPLISTASAPRFDSRFRGSIPGPTVPLSTLRRRGCPHRRMTRGRCGSLRLQRFELPSIAPRRLAGARRSEDPKKARRQGVRVSRRKTDTTPAFAAGNRRSEESKRAWSRLQVAVTAARATAVRDPKIGRSEGRGTRTPAGGRRVDCAGTGRCKRHMIRSRLHLPVPAQSHRAPRGASAAA